MKKLFLLRRYRVSLCYRCWNSIGGAGVHMIFERYDGIWISDIRQNLIPQLCAWYWDSFFFLGCSLIIYMYIRAVSSYYPRYLIVSEVKVFFFTFDSATTWRFLYKKDASFSCKKGRNLITDGWSEGDLG